MKKCVLVFPNFIHISAKKGSRLKWTNLGESGQSVHFRDHPLSPPWTIYFPHAEPSTFNTTPKNTGKLYFCESTRWFYHHFLDTVCKFLFRFQSTVEIRLTWRPFKLIRCFYSSKFPADFDFRWACRYFFIFGITGKVHGSSVGKIGDFQIEAIYFFEVDQNSWGRIKSR